MRKLALLTLSLALLVGSMSSIATPRHAAAKTREPFDNGTSFDIRTFTHRQPLASAINAAASLRAEVPDSRVTWDDTLGTAKLVFSASGYLSPKANQGVVATARAWLTAHRGLFGV